MIQYLNIFVFLAAASFVSAQDPVYLYEYQYDVDIVKDIISFEENNTVLRIKENDYFYTIQLGKAMTYMAWRDWATLMMPSGDCQVIFEQLQNPQMFNFRTPVPIPLKGFKSYLLPDTRLNFVYKQNSNVFSLFQEGSSEIMNATTGETVPGYPVQAASRTIPGAAAPSLALRYFEAYFSIYSLGLSQNYTETFQRQLASLYEGLFNSEQMFFDLEEPYSHQERLEEFHEDIRKFDLSNGEVLYADTDESFHLWTARRGREAYLVDCGSLYLSKGLQAVLEEHRKVRSLYIIPTHFHMDHVATLAAFIRNSEVEDMTLVVGDGLVLGFIGWYLENFNFLKQKLLLGQLKIVVADDQGWTRIGSHEVKMLMSNRFPDPRLRHFISNSSPVIRDSWNNYRIFSGDLQKPAYGFIPKEDFFSMVQSSFSQIFQFGEVPASANIDCYYDLGLFYFEMMLYEFQADEVYRVTVEEFLAFVYESFPEYSHLDLKIIHVIQDEFFSLQLTESFSKN